MYFKTILLHCVFISVIYQGAYGDKEETKNDESVENLSNSTTRNVTSVEEGPPDSHEAMNNRELKPKLTEANRKKRSYEFLMGLVKRNSKYEVTNHDNIPRTTERVTTDEVGESELLLELMVKIAGDPDQWTKVHNMLQKIDNDLIKSKQIVESIKEETKNKIMDNNTFETIKTTESAPVTFVQENKRIPDVEVDELKTLTTLNKINKSKTVENNEPESDEVSNTKLNNIPLSETTKYPWQLSTKPSKNLFQKNFAYHRVTGNPLYHSNYNKNPKAYIAVSVIAPKPMHTSIEQELTLENQLRELKPWTHQRNLKNMAEIRSGWIIQTNEENKPLYAH